MLSQIAFYTVYYTIKWTWSGMLWVAGYKSTEQRLREEIDELRNEISEIRDGGFVLVDEEQIN